MQTRNFFLGAVIGSLLVVAAFSRPALIQIPAISDQEPADRQSGVIRGQVFAAEGEHPLARARVRLYSTGGRAERVTRTVRTDSRGKYEIRNLGAGSYGMRASRNGYLSRSYSREISSQSGRRRRSLTLSLAAGEVLDGIDFPLIQGGVVEGTVVDPYNEPRSRVSVTLSEYKSYGGERELVPAGRAKTDDRGRFRLFDIRPGSYYLSAVPRPLDDREEADRSFPPVYYPGVLNPQEAAKVEVAAGEEVGGFYFTLIEARSYGISGRVLTPEGKPAHSVWLRSRRESDEFLVSGMEPSADTDRQGEFKVKGLLPGKHRLIARSEGDEDLRMASAVVDVTDQDIEGLTLVLAAGAEVTGRIVTDREEVDLDWRRISLSMEPIGSAWRYAGGGRSRIEEDFTFKIKDVPEASYRLVVRIFNTPGNHYIESIRIRTEELIDRPIEVRSGDLLDGVEIHVSSEGAQISGVVEKEEGREVAQAATVLVFAADSEYRGRHSRFTRRVRTDQRGQFSLKGLVPAEYLVCALTDLEYGLESNLDYLRNLERDAERIDLSQGQRLEKNLVALPAPKVH